MAFGFHLRTDNDQSVVQEVGKIEEFVVDDQFAGIENTALRSRETFPENPSGSNASSGYARSTTLPQSPGQELRQGNQDPIRQEVVR